MFNFKQELAKYRESLEVEDLAEGLSGEEIQDILDVARALAGAQQEEPVKKRAESR
ncbi:MAG: hypothetical protein HFE64_07815 [Lachnospiraceae bacterium]|jgi:hypothetical protein|nr:hypothetical protein [Lachnospiraceae bacterium]